MTRKEFLGIGGLAVASLFGIGGIIKQLASHAATANLTTEPETGSLIGPVTKTTDTAASGATAITFGKTATNYRRPTGAGYYPIETLGVPLTDLRAAIAKVPVGGTLTLPPGTWTLPDFDDPNNPATVKKYYALFCDQKGIIGSGASTIITVAPYTATNLTRGIIRFNSGSPKIAQLTVIGTPQRAVNPDYGQTVRWDYTPVSLYYTTNPIITDVKVQGGQGSWNSPLYFKDATTYPAQGETGMLSLNRTNGARLTRVELDGRDAAGAKASGCGFGINSCNDIAFTDCYVHHTGYSHGYAFYRCKKVRTSNCGAEYCGQSGGTGSETAGTRGDGFNHEQTWDSYHSEPYSGFNSLAESRYYGNAETPTGAPDTNMSNFGGNTSPHVVDNLRLTDGGLWDVRIDNLQTTYPTVINGPALHRV